MTDLTKENFEEEVLKAWGYALVGFCGDGCVPCAALMPYIHKSEEVYGTTVEFCSLNTTKVRRLAIAQRVLGLPMTAIYKDGEMIDSRVKDNATPGSYEEMIKKYTWCPDMAGGPVRIMHNRRRGWCIKTAHINAIKKGRNNIWLY